MLDITDMKETPKAARSVHLWYQSPEATCFHNEVLVEESQNGSYFCVCGFHAGYFGMQQLASENEKVMLFSVWDPGNQNDPDAVDPSRRVVVLSSANDARIKRFGREGTGAQCFFEFNWSVGEKYRFEIKSTPCDDRTAYSAYFYLNDRFIWKHLATFSTITDYRGIRGFYSFVEDFRRDGLTPTLRRSAVFSDGWTVDHQETCHSLRNAKFAADDNPLVNINAESLQHGFRLSTGGCTIQTTELNSMLSY